MICIEEKVPWNTLYPKSARVCQAMHSLVTGSINSKETWAQLIEDHSQGRRLGSGYINVITQG